jgi:hypothetical protein
MDGQRGRCKAQGKGNEQNFQHVWQLVR